MKKAKPYCALSIYGFKVKPIRYVLVRFDVAFAKQRSRCTVSSGKTWLVPG
jgi:hypothetical protein